MMALGFKSFSAGALLIVFLLVESGAGQSLDKQVGTPKPYNWDAAMIWAKEPAMNPVLQVLKNYGIPSATIGYQLNPDPAKIAYSKPLKFRKPQAWWMAGFGIDYRAPMRVASVSKPVLAIVYRNTPALNAMLDVPFYGIWKTLIDSKVAEPLDQRVKQITFRHLIAHTGGFDNGMIGYDPAFAGKTVDSQFSSIIKSTSLKGEPGTSAADSYSNFGYMILARLAEALTGQKWIDLVRASLPQGAPIYAASDTVPVSAKAVPNAGASEPRIYYIQGSDGPFDVTPMMGNGNLVSNVATLSWVGCHYHLGGPDVGVNFASSPPVGSGWFGIFNGSMPGTEAALVQYITPSRRIAAMCVIVNTRKPGSMFLEELNSAMQNFLQAKFGSL